MTQTGTKNQSLLTTFCSMSTLTLPCTIQFKGQLLYCIHCTAFQQKLQTAITLLLDACEWQYISINLVQFITHHKKLSRCTPFLLFAIFVKACRDFQKLWGVCLGIYWGGRGASTVVHPLMLCGGCFSEQCGDKSHWECCKIKKRKHIVNRINWKYHVDNKI